MSFVSFLFIVHIFVVTRNSLLSSLPSFDVVHESGREGMARREEWMRLSKGAGRAGEFCVVSIYCAHFMRLLATHSCHPLTWSARRAGMAAWRAKMRGVGSQKGPGGTGPQAARGAWVSFVSFLIIVHILCGYSQTHSCFPLVFRRGR